ncbi:MAG: NAD(P)/FAD-dependent oxidoreductase [Acidimicrobiia bacterium]|jgi:4-hydroxyacetophenone monooxygenase
MPTPAPAPEHNPHEGLPFTDDDATIAAALEDVSIPALMCSMVHLTGDPEWVRGDIKPAGLFLNEYQGYLDEDTKAEARRRALPKIIDFRDNGCVLPPPPSREVLHEMMCYLACADVDAAVEPMFVDDLHLDGADSGAITWGDAVPADVKADAPVVVIGCGEAGLLAGIRLQEAGLPFTIVEKNAGPGGTWWENRYPGARVDVGSHFYCYSFEPADHWTEYFSQQSELQEYFVRVMDHHGLRANIRFETEVTAATYDEATARWSVEVRTADGATETLDARFVVSAVGSLNRPKLPDIPGMDDFAGPSFHSARWDHSVDYRGKRFAMIGAGASGFQIAPTIADDVAQLTVFQRTAQWMFPNPNYHLPVPQGDKWAMRHLPFYGRWFRFLTFYPGAGLTIEGSRVDPGYDDGSGLAVSPGNETTRQMFTSWIESQIGDDPELLAKVVPDYPATGKRTLQDNGSWLTCLKKDDVELVRTPIARVVADGVVTEDGTHHPADVICYATGFRHTEYLWPMEVIGRGGRRLHEQWDDRPSAYLGITIPSFPNLFCVYGPGTNLAHGGSLIFQSECQINYLMDAIGQTLTGGHHSVEVRQDAHDRYVQHYRSEISQMVWAHPSVTHSHYKNARGEVWTLSPWPIPTYWTWTRAADPADYTFT